ncbi:acyltransferase, partial [Aeromonas hydrophila]
MGRVKRIQVRIEELPVDEALIGDYFNDKQFKRGFQEWLNQRWQEKDEVLEGWQSGQAPLPVAAKSGDESKENAEANSAN